MPRGTGRLDEAKLQQRLWTPAVWQGTAKLYQWFDAINSPITFATGISQWNDISGNARHATQVTSASQPSFFATGWVPGTVCRPAISGSGNKNFTFTGPSLGGSGFSTQTVINNSNAASNRVIMGGGTAACEIRLTSTQKVDLLRATQAGLLTTTASVPSGYNVVGADFTSSLCRAWINGTSEENSTSPGFTASTFIFSSAGDPNFDSSMGELVWSNQKLTSFETALLVGYLAWKWGTVANLPALHPFKNRPPLIGD